jgi:glycosyltransferase involved in cell wall biosynthesis
VLKVALFHPKFAAVGGAELLLLKQAELLRDAGCRVAILTFEVTGTTWKSRLDGWPVQVIPKRSGWDFLTAFSRSSKLKTRGRRAEPLLQGFDRILATNHPCSTMLGLMTVPGRRLWYCNEPYRRIFPRESGPRATAALEALGPVNPALQATAADLQRAEASRDIRAVRSEALAGLARIDHTLFNSRFTMANAQACNPAQAGEVLHPIIDFRPPAPRPRRLDRKALKVLVQSRLTPLKNLETLVQGFLLFQAEQPGAELHIVGSGPAEPGLRKLAGQAPEGVITFHGFLDAGGLDELRSRCDVFALLPLDEPFGMVFPEAAAQGLLLVGPDHGGPLEILEEGRLGWLCDPFAPASFKEALAALCDTGDGELDQRRHEADRSCRARFSVETLGPRLVKALA